MSRAGRGEPHVLLEGVVDDVMTTWAVPAAQAVAVRAVDLVPLPDPAPGVAGLQQVGGDALPVTTLISDVGTRVLLVAAGGRRCAILVSRVRGVTPLAAPGPTPAGQAQPYARGVTAHEEATVLVLDVPLLLDLIDPTPAGGGR